MLKIHKSAHLENNSILENMSVGTDQEINEFWVKNHGENLRGASTHRYRQTVTGLLARSYLVSQKSVKYCRVESFAFWKYVPSFIGYDNFWHPFFGKNGRNFFAKNGFWYHNCFQKPLNMVNKGE